MATKKRSPLGIDPCDDQDDPIFNATTLKKNVVDPRTGLFEAYVPLPRVTANLGRGPVVDLSLFYTPMVNNHACLGDGWSFAFTYYNERLKLLRLSTGEFLRFDMDFDINVSTPVKVDYWHPDIYVTLADGRKEQLAKVGDTDIWLVNTLFTPEGFKVDLEWNASPEDGVVYIQLRSVADNYFKLATIDYGSVNKEKTRTMAIKFWPDDPVEKLTYTLEQQKYALRSITAPDGTVAKFEYMDHESCGWLLHDLTTFQGVRESASYNKSQVEFTDNKKISALPCVTQHTLRPLGKVTAVITDYQYSKPGAASQNVSHETRVTQASNVTVISYDERHEVMHEYQTFVEGDDISKKVKHTYSMDRDPNQGTRRVGRQYIDDLSGGQKSQLQCSEWFEGKLCFRSSAEQTSRIFNAKRSYTEEFVNLTKILTPCPKKRVQESSLFKALVEATPAWRGGKFDNEWDNAYFSVELSGDTEHMRDGEDDPSEFLPTVLKAVLLNKWYKPTVVWVGLNHSADAPPVWSTVINTYHDGGDLNYGRLRGSKQSDSEFEYSYALDGTALTTTTQQKIGVSSRVSSETHSVLSGRLIKQQDIDGNVSTYEYDGAGRLIKFTQCALSETYRQVTSYFYPELGRVETTEPDGRRYATQEDGQGNVVVEYFADSPTRPWRPLLKVSYDECGRKSKSTRFDDQDGDAMMLESRFEYDEWGEECEEHTTINYDDVGDHDLSDELTRESAEESAKEGDEESGTVSAELLEKEWFGKVSLGVSGELNAELVGKIFDRSSDELGYVQRNERVAANHYDPIAQTRTQRSSDSPSQSKVTTYNNNGSTAKIEWRGANNIVWQTRTFTYTHASQVATQTTDGPHGHHRISYAYDAAGRPVIEDHVEKASRDESRGLLSYSFSYEYPADLQIREATKISLDGQVLGERTFDAWGRIISLTRGGVTETFTYEGATSVPGSKSCAGQTLRYTYIPELGQEMESVRLDNKQAEDKCTRKSFTYAHGSTKQSSVSEGEQLLEFNHDLNERITLQRASLHKKEFTVKRNWSEAGRLLSETDVTGSHITYGYTSGGLRSNVAINDKVVTTHSYKYCRLSKDVVTQDQDEITVEYFYDFNGLETGREFRLASSFWLRLDRNYFADGKLKSITLSDKTQAITLGSHTYTYSPGGRLAGCVSKGCWQLKTPKGAPIDKQEFTHDPLGNVTQCISSIGKERCVSTYTYDADKGYRLRAVEHDHPDYKTKAVLEYDAAGRVIRDINGKTYSYDWLGRLIQAGSRHYTYDPSDRLASGDSDSATAPHQVIYDGFRVRGEFAPDGGVDTRQVLPGSSACQVQFRKSGSDTRTMLALCDDDGTVLITFDLASRVLRHHAYSPYGERSSGDKEVLHGFNGEYLIDDNEQYPLGYGYRWYAPQSMQFQAPDNLSPFDEGGPHPYGYCDGDPVN